MNKLLITSLVSQTPAATGLAAVPQGLQVVQPDAQLLHLLPPKLDPPPAATTIGLPDLEVEAIPEETAEAAGPPEDVIPAAAADPALLAGKTEMTTSMIMFCSSLAITITLNSAMWTDDQQADISQIVL